MNISITGTLGSGKSSVCKLLKEKGYDIISNGVLFREIAEEKGVSVVELNEIAKTDKSIDDMLDERSIRLGKEVDETIFDSRMGWHFIPDSFKVFLLADMKEAGRRVYNDNRVSESYQDEASAQAVLIQRQLMEKKRFSSLYEVDYLDLTHYNLLIESTYATPEEISEQILEGVKNYKEGNRFAMLNPKSLYIADNGKKDGDITVTVKHNKFFVVSGVAKVEELLKNKTTFAQVVFDKEAECVVPSAETMKKYEAEHEFTYLEYPDESAETILELTSR